MLQFLCKCREFVDKLGGGDKPVIFVGRDLDRVCRFPTFRATAFAFDDAETI